MKKIKNRKADIGMSSLQVRIALGYPDEIIIHLVGMA